VALSTPDVLRTVEEIESFKPKLQLRAFYDIEILHQAEIDCRASWHCKCVTPEIAQSIGRRQNEGGGVIIQIRSPLPEFLPQFPHNQSGEWIYIYGIYQVVFEVDGNAQN